MLGRRSQPMVSGSATDAAHGPACRLLGCTKAWLKSDLIAWT